MGMKENFSFYIESPKLLKSDNISSVAVRNGDFLLMARRKDNNRWTLPGGHANQDEVACDAAVRELAEEAGITTEPRTLEFLGEEKVISYTGKPIVVSAYQYRTSGPKPTTKWDHDDEVTRWQWIDISNGLPGDIKDNLHSPKNVVLEKMGLLKSDLFKAGKGAGSRGGKVIGHTRTGKPIYANSRHKGHEQFSAEEHKDAAGIHDRAGAHLFDEHHSYHRMLSNPKELDRVNSRKKALKDVRDSRKRVKDLESRIRALGGTVKSEFVIDLIKAEKKKKKKESLAQSPTPTTASNRKSIKFEIDLIKSTKGHKYIRRFKKAGKYVYIYHHPKGKERLSEKQVDVLKQLAEMGDDAAKKLHGSIEDHDVRKLKILKQLAELGDKGAIKKLEEHGIEQKEIEGDPTPVVEVPKKKKELSGDDKRIEELRAHLAGDGRVTVNNKLGSVWTLTYWDMPDAAGGIAHDAREFLGDDWLVRPVRTTTKHAKQSKITVSRKIKKEEKPEPKPKPKKKVEVPTPPRKEAEEVTEKAKEDHTKYDYVSKNSVINLGEDVWGSARHKRAVWKGLDGAEKDGKAEEMINRETLLQMEPPNLSEFIEGGFQEYDVLASYLILKTLPPRPAGTRYDKEPDDKIIYYTRRDKSLYTGEPTLKVIATSLMRDGDSPVTAGDFKKSGRRIYYESYKALKELVEEELKQKTPAKEIIKKSVDRMKEITTQYRTDPVLNFETYNSLVKYKNKTLFWSGWGRNTSTTVQGKLDEFKKNLANVHSESDEDLDKIAKEALFKIVDGTSIPKALGVSSTWSGRERKAKFSAADLYVKSAERKGPKTKTPKVTDDDLNSAGSFQSSKAAKFLMDDLKMRGIQPGNSLTKEEQKHHVEQFGNAMSDITDILGLPKEMASFNGKLSIAFGSRGVARALAHYEPDNRIINLTRSSGVGSLAHEWGHFFDNILANVVHGNTSRRAFLSETVYVLSNHEEHTGKKRDIYNAVAGLKKEFLNMKDRLRSDENWRNLSPKDKEYWGSDIEMWARCFERHIQEELHNKGRENTYLVGLRKEGHPFWPSKEEAAKMKPHWDALFSAFSNSEYVKKAMMFVINASI